MDCFKTAPYKQPQPPGKQKHYSDRPSQGPEDQEGEQNIKSRPFSRVKHRPENTKDTDQRNKPDDYANNDQAYQRQFEERISYLIQINHYDYDHNRQNDC